LLPVTILPPFADSVGDARLDRVDRPAFWYFEPIGARRA
jgi:hypothetical protein